MTFLEVLGFEMGFVDGWRTDEDDGRVVASDAGMGDDFPHVFLVFVQRHVLACWHCRDIGVIRAKKDELENVSIG